MGERNENNLVHIGQQDAGAASHESKVSRRSFLKILGSGSALGVAGCASDAGQKVFSSVKGEYEQIPGVAVWYKSFCSECSAGCGVQVRTRGGRAVKIEGHPDNPINKGGLCGLGQAALQSLYDPDRVRQPLKKEVGASGESIFAPVSWDEALKDIAEALNDNEREHGILTGEVAGSLRELLDSFCKTHNVKRVAFDPLQPSALATASKKVFDQEGIPFFAIDRADVLLNFGADFLETWVSPVGFARDWAKARRSKQGLKFIHVEPRLSLTGANADLWVRSQPGSEMLFLQYLTKKALEDGRGAKLSKQSFVQLEKLVGEVSEAKVLEQCGVSKDQLERVTHTLLSAKSPLVLGGGVIGAGSNSESFFVLLLGLNLVLGAEGNTIDLSRVRKVESSFPDVQRLVESLEADKIGALFVYGTNPAFTLPGKLGFSFAQRKAKMLISLSSSLDETAELADYILPLDSSLECWGDAMPLPGVHNIQQPAMRRLFDTRSPGDIFLQLNAAAGEENEQKDFYEFLRARWEGLYEQVGSESFTDFEDFWRRAVENGGYFPERKKVAKSGYSVAKGAFVEALSLPEFEKEGVTGAEVVLYPYPSVKSFDGRAANRPWLQELPDPITRAVWDSWAELHPETAKSVGLANGDFVTLRNHYGEVTVPVYITDYVAPGIAALPLGQGHTAFGRYAKEVKDANVYALLGAGKDHGNFPLFSAKSTLLRGRGRAELVVAQGNDSQLGRHLAKEKVVHQDKEAAHEGGHDHHGHHGEPKQMYEQREHPLYEWGLTVDLDACSGCGACVVACYAENNIPVVGKEVTGQGRNMAWLQIDRYYEGPAEELSVLFQPRMCQQCNNAPCEVVCPVYATYHNEEGLNAMIYNRCVGTRYCANNCPYKVRRFNWFEYEWPEPSEMQLNPDVTKRSVGVMEKCTFCVQRIREAEDQAKDKGRMVRDGEVQPACVQSCPTEALTFGNLQDKHSAVGHKAHDKRAYKMLDHHLNTQPSVSYLKARKFTV